MKRILILFIFIIFVSVSPVFADPSADSKAGAIIDNSGQDNRIKNYDRKLIQGIPVTAGTNGFFAAPTPDSSFKSIKDVFHAFSPGSSALRITEGALENWAKGGDVDPHLQIARDHDMVPRVYTKRDDVRWLTLAIEEPVVEIVDGKEKVVGTIKISELQVTGFIDGEADDGETNSLQVIGECGLEALEDGNNYMVITAEGAHRKVEAFGYGFGTYAVYAGNWDSGKQGGGGGGGLGFAANETGPEDRPWIQGYVGCKQ